MDFCNSQKDLKQNESIAVIGMSCIFPGQAKDLEGFWGLLAEGMHIMSEVPESRFVIDQLYDTELKNPNSISTKYGAFLQNISGFDANFFNISAREAITMDPQQRLLLECCWHALEDAGITDKQLADCKTGVYIGACKEEYKQLLEKSKNFINYEPYVTTSTLLSGLSGRISNVLDLDGPAITINTHYSSSLVAVHSGCQDLELKNCDMCIVGGVQVILTPEDYILMSHNRTLSQDGFCKTFDNLADGFGYGEGCGLLILKRLTDALQNKDKIYAVIRGTGVNQNGHSLNMAATSKTAQQELIKQVLMKSKINPSDVTFVEAHGTGTPLGDITEMEAINYVFEKSHSKDNPLFVGSVKTNIGHLGPAAGIAGIIKAILMLKNKQVPKHLHLKQINKNINLELIPVQIPNELISLKNRQKPLIAGVSAYGITGTNAHVILEEFTSEEFVCQPENDNVKTWCLLCISAKTTSALKSMAISYQNYLKTTNENFLDICFTAGICRSHFEHRLAIVAANKADAIRQIDSWLNHERINKYENNDPWLKFYQSVADLYVAGEDISIAAFAKQKNQRRVDIPRYKFEHVNYWFDQETVESLSKEDIRINHTSLDHCLQIKNIENRKITLKKQIETIVRDIVLMPTTSALKPNISFIDLGINSLLAVEFRDRIVDLIGQQYDEILFDTLIFNYPNIESLVDYLIEEVIDGLDVTENSTIENTDSEELDKQQLLFQIDQQMNIAKSHLQSIYKD